MPPGIDGIQTTARLLKEDPDVGIVICSAYSDHSWEEMTEAFGKTDRVLILKKPFDTVEVRQLAHALQRRWELARLASLQGRGPDGRHRRANARAQGRERGPAARRRRARRRVAPARRVERADPRAGLPGRAHRTAEPPLVQRAPREGARPRASARAPSSRCCSSTSTTSSSSTTRSATRLPTRCCASSPHR